MEGLRHQSQPPCPSLSLSRPSKESQRRTFGLVFGLHCAMQRRLAELVACVVEAGRDTGAKSHQVRYARLDLERQREG